MGILLLIEGNFIRQYNHQLLEKLNFYRVINRYVYLGTERTIVKYIDLNKKEWG